MHNSDELFNLVFESNSRIMRFYKETILLNFKKNSKDNNALSARQFFILYIILYKKVNTITEISKHLNLSKANISILTSKLEDAGYVSRNKLLDIDSRISSLEVTELGKEVYNETSAKVGGLLADQVQKYEDGFSGFVDLLFDLKKCLKIDSSINEPEAIMLLGFIKLESIYEDIYNRILLDIDVKISIAEIKIIKLVAEHDNINFEGLTHYSALSYSTLSLQVKALVDRGFITKIKSREDGRVTYLKLTDLGKKIDDTFNNKKGDVILKVLSDSTTDEINFAYDTFSTLFKAMEIVEPVWL